MPIQIWKSENCSACFNCVSSRVSGEELEVICQLEMNGDVEEIEIEDDDDTYVCEVFAIRGVREDLLEDPEHEEHKKISQRVYKQDDDMVPSNALPDEVTNQRMGEYVFLGDLLVEGSTGQASLIPANFVEAWNADIVNVKTELEQEIDGMRGQLQSRIDTYKNSIINNEIDWEAGVNLRGEDDLINIDDLDLEEDELDELLEDDDENGDEFELA